MDTNGDIQYLQNELDDNFLVKAKKLLNDYFVTREDKIAVYPQWTVNIAGDLENYIEKHLEGTNRVGFYNLNHESLVRWGVIDLDDHKDEKEIQSHIAAFVTSFKELSHQLGLSIILEISKRLFSPSAYARKSKRLCISSPQPT